MEWKNDACHLAAGVFPGQSLPYGQNWPSDENSVVCKQFSFNIFFLIEPYLCRWSHEILFLTRHHEKLATESRSKNLTQTNC